MNKKFVRRIVLKILHKINYFFLDPQKILLGQIAAKINKIDKSNLKKLWDYEIKVFSQWGEDGILDYLCFEMEINKPRILELGAGNFLECNSRFLTENLNASAVLVDSRKDLASTVKSMDIFWKASLLPLNKWITPETVNNIQTEANNFMNFIDIISLDIDGNDYWVAQNINFSEVKIVLVEYNPIFGGRQAVTIPRKDDFDRTNAHYSNLYFGASLRAWINFFKKNNLQFIGSNRAGNNAFFVVESSLSRLNLEIPNTADLSLHVDWRVRESRDVRGELTYLSIEKGRELISDLPLIDLENNKQIRVSDLVF